MLAAQKLPPDWRAAIIENHAIVVARTHNAHLYVGRPVRPDLHGHMLRAPEGAYESLTLDRIAAVTMCSLAPASQWTVALGITLTERNASLYQAIAWLAVCTVAAAGGRIATDWLLAHAGAVDLVLMDVQRPVMDGIEATRILRVATCNRKRFDLHSAAFSTGINCVQRAPQTRDNCELTCI